MDPAASHRLVRAFEPVWGVCMRGPELLEAFAGFEGVVGLGRYFATRSAPLGAVPAEVVASAFYNFAPEAIRPHIPAAWDVASPQQFLDAEFVGVGAALRRALAPLPESLVADTANTLRKAALAAAEHPEGRVLFAARSAMEWPDEPHLVVFHSQMMLREYRGDGHVAVLVGEGLGGAEAFALHLATGPDLPVDLWRPSRMWPDDKWQEALANLRERGWLTGDGLTPTAEGQRARLAIEHATDAIDTLPYEAIGQDGRELLLASAEQITEAINAAGIGGLGTAMYRHAEPGAYDVPGAAPK